MAEWEFDPARPSCKQCSQFWKNHDTPTHEDRVRFETTCWNCPKPELLPINLEAWDFFQLVRDQVLVAGMGTVIGLNKATVLQILQVYGVHDSEDLTDLLEKIMVLHGVEMKFATKLKKVTSGRSTATVRGPRRRIRRP